MTPRHLASILRVAACVLGLALCAAPGSAQTASFSPALDGQLAFPQNGSIGWTAVSGAYGYRLILGTAAGDTDVLDTGVTTATSWPTTGVALPAGREIFARLYTVSAAGHWTAVDARFAVRGINVALYDAASGRWALPRVGTLDPANQATPWSAGWSLWVASFNRDGLDDLLYYNRSTGYWYKGLQQADGSFTYVGGYPWSTGWEPTIVDLDGDGRSDVFLYNVSTGRWFTCLTVGDGDFQYREGRWDPGWTVTALDFDKDRRGDLFLYNDKPAHPNHGLWVKVFGLATAAPRYEQANLRWSPDWRVYAGDFDADGRSDVFVYEPGTGRYFVCVSLTTGFSYYGGTIEAGWTVTPVAIDTDRRTDLFFYRPSDGRWRASRTTVTLGFESVTSVWSADWRLRAADLDADGRTDFVLYNQASGRWATVRTAGLGLFAYDFGYWSAGFTESLPMTVAMGALQPPAPAGWTGGLLSLPTSTPLTWPDAPFAAAYRLLLGTQPGTSDVLDTGEIVTPFRFLDGVRTSVTLYARLGVRRGTAWTWTSFTLSRRDSGAVADATRIQAALDATARTRAMADDNNMPFSWTPLARTAPGGASCANYASMLVDVLRQANVGIGNRVLQVAFNSNPYDRHTLVEAWSSAEQRWMLLDPTFSLTLRLASGVSATAEDVWSATRAKDFARITYVPLDGKAFDRLRDYYFDYPLLYLFIRQNGSFAVQLSTLLPYVQYVATLPAQRVTTPGVYAIESGGVLGPVLYYPSISAPAGSATATVYRPLRFVWQ